MKIAISEDIVMRKRPFIRSGSSKVMNFGTNRKRVYIVIHVSCTVSEIRRFKGRKSPILPTHRHLTLPLRGTLALEKLEGWGMGLLCGENCMILASTAFGILAA